MLLGSISVSGLRRAMKRRAIAIFSKVGILLAIRPGFGALWVAESRAVRRVYGVQLSRDKNLSIIIDGVLVHAYRFKKRIYKFIYTWRCLGEPNDGKTIN